MESWKICVLCCSETVVEKTKGFPKLKANNLKRLCLPCQLLISSARNGKKNVASGTGPVQGGGLPKNLQVFKEVLWQVDQVVKSEVNKKRLEEVITRLGDKGGIVKKVFLSWRNQYLKEVKDLKRFRRQQRVAYDKKAKEASLNDFTEANCGSRDPLEIKREPEDTTVQIEEGECPGHLNAELKPRAPRKQKLEPSPLLIEYYTPPTPETAKKRRLDLTKAEERTFAWILRGTSPFKKGLIRRVFLRTRRLKAGTTGTSPSPVAELLASLDQNYMIEYDDTQDKLHVRNTEILINETEESLQCSVCGHREFGREPDTVSRKVTVEQRLLEHLLGKHLQAYRCDCGLLCKSRRNYREHLMICQDPTNPRFPGDIVDKPCRPEKKNLQVPEDDKEKALVRKHGKVPEESKHNFKCSRCGRGYTSKRNLNKHLKGPCGSRQRKK